MTRYEAVARAIAERISEGELVAGDRLESERDFAVEFGVSRVTVRRALLELQSRGLVEPENACGWFVGQSGFVEEHTLMGFSDMAKVRGFSASSTVVSKACRSATIEESEALGVVAGSRLFDIERLRKLDDVAIAIERSRVPLRFAPDIESVDLERGSLYAHLRARGAAPCRADYALQAVQATQEQCAFLQIPRGFALLQTTATTYDAKGRAIELSRSIYRGDRYRFCATLVRPDRDGSGPVTRVQVNSLRPDAILDEEEAQA